MRQRFIRVSLASVAFISSSTPAQLPGPYPYQSLRIETVANGCGAGNPFYKIVNSTKYAVNLKLCREDFQSGTSLKRSFQDAAIRSGETRSLTCQFSRNIRTTHSIHWQQRSPRVPPRDITVARQSIELFNPNSSSDDIWSVANWHHFKPIRVTYRRPNGRLDSPLIEPQSSTVLLGRFSAQPVITEVSFATLPYDALTCLNGVDRYPREG